ncbi:alpha/beta fold hydrolase [Phenylobacterium soli]|uniref:Alpha/beta hydrolase n=1 Tax=Phenylobacterium soli TaxID=2170551 RepID=A0A328AIB4_9CAUL|nr:alpha/beta hydrolase [Phenylobacterium soli]RAK53134.1 alpha/beta hydrolase [Phenylobacterium soli]
MNRRLVLQTAALGGAGALAATLASPAAAAVRPRPAAPPPLGSADVRAADGAALACTDWGSGPPVVFVSSWAMPSRMWQAQVAALSQAGLRCVAFDRRGHGRSPDPGRGYDMDTLAADLAAVLDQLDLRGVTLVGHSMGCAEAIRYLARDDAGRVKRAVLLAPAAPYLTRTADNPFGLPPEAHDQIRAAWTRDFPRWVADNARPFYTPETSAEAVAYGAQMLLECPLPVVLACNRALTATDLRADCAKVAVPTRVIHGDMDASAPLEMTGRRVAALIPGAELVVLKGAPHGLFTTHAEAVNQHILAAARA